VKLRGFLEGSMVHTNVVRDRLWAPWRFSYMRQADETDGGCLFDRVPKSDEDKTNLLLFRGRTAFVILNAYPYNSGHLMVAPYRHVANLEDLTDEEMLDVQKLLRDSVRWLKKAYCPEGFNLGVNLGRSAGAGIEGHLHWHVVPRWAGDTNFMPVLGETKVLPQTLEESYELLRKIVEDDGAVGR
jgi:ATP adenylyltransferase